VAAKLEAELRKELGLKTLAPEPPAPTLEQKQAATAAHGKSPVGKR
jgi:hypothetical protein